MQVPWLWAKKICQTFSAIPEPPVLPKNTGTSKGQSEWWRHVSSWENLETDHTCILSQHSLLGKGAESQVSQCCLWTERGHSCDWLWGSQIGRTPPLKLLPQPQGPWLRTFAPPLTHKSNAPGGTSRSITPFPAVSRKHFGMKESSRDLFIAIISDGTRGVMERLLPHH